MSRVVAVMREFARRGAEQAALQDLNEIVRGAVAVTRAQWHQVAELTLTLDEALPRVMCVGVLIKQVVLYAIMNAVKALSPSDGIQRSRGCLHIQTQMLGTGWVAIDLTDSGDAIGSDGARALDPVPDSSQLGDTAQALAHIRGVIVGGHGGELEITSEARCGTRLRIRLPVKRLSAPR